MKAFVVLAALVAAASASPQLLYNNLGYYGYGGLGAVTYSSPVVSQAIVAPAVTKTQYHAQDELGQASYGYAHPGQAHAAVRDAAGNVRGSYAYVNPEGKEVRVEYVADAGGFRVASNALPVGPVAGPVPVTANLIAPAPVQDTPEVVQARAAHAVAHAEALARSGRKKRGIVTSAVLPSAVGYSSVLTHPYGYSSYVAQPSVHGYSNIVSQPSVLGYSNIVSQPSVLGYSTVAAPAVVAAAQPVREATLTKVVNTPGHAVSYRVD
ncbi:Cuticle protein 7 [Orchesella cincta]|uniref:Cuticle protein 7 n=1 Tax=Orchesella cincta TaxID=48709 RepID=A0A1D2NE64_ORCCI|nr:Cuticle protein 7 [Orchesella cincta]